MRRILFNKATRASILIIVLWSLCLLSIFAVYLGYIVRQKMTLAKRLDEKASAHFIAEAGVKMSVSVLKALALKDCQSLKEPWSSNPDLFKDVNIDGGTYNVCYNYVDEFTGAEETRYGLIDEERKININKADRQVVARLFSLLFSFDETQALELAATIEDWRDPDSQPVIPFGSAEDPFYTALTHPYGAKNSDIEVLEELLLVKGMTKDMFDKIKDYLTVYGSGKVNINTASKKVLMALGLSPENAEKILACRRGKDGVEGTADDNIFVNPADILPLLSQSYNLGASDIAQIGAVATQYLGTKSGFFNIRSQALLANKKHASNISCIADKSGKILYWNEN
ncbi:MAG: general secretion pathway protein GspK [Candidatus Omnitrophica bacterium]|nr:general secretion pathway protein GspK [Candidatus Omnitrophota bacterium]